MFTGRVSKLMRLNNKGFMTISFVIIIALVMIIVLEIYRDYEIHRHITTTMERLVNMALSIAISEDTKEDFAIIDETIAEIVFNDLLVTELGLNADNTYGDNYELNITSFTIIKQPPAIEVTGEIIASPFLLSSSVVNGIKVKLPFEARSRSQHIGY